MSSWPKAGLIMSAWPPVDGGAPSGPAGGDLTGSYPNPTLANTAQARTNIGIPLPLAIASGGTAQTTAQAARGFLGLNVEAVTNNGDANYVSTASDRTVNWQTILTAPRVHTLPAANTTLNGQIFIVADKGAVNGANTITVTCAGTDHFVGGATTNVISVAGNVRVYQSDGVSLWSIVSVS